MKTILLTGAGGGIGSVIKKALEQSGDRVIGIGRADADLSVHSDIQKLQDKAQGGIDWLVCAHGYIDTETDLEKQRPEDIKTTFDVNIISLVYLTQILLPHIRSGGGVIFISSSAGLNPNGRYAAYSASKAAVNAFSQALAHNKPELVCVSVCPGPTNTGMRERVAHDAAKHQSPEVIAAVVADILNGKGEYKSGDVVLVKDGLTSIASRI